MRALNFDLTTTAMSSIANHPVTLGTPFLAMQVRFPSWNSLQWESLYACRVGRQLSVHLLRASLRASLVLKP
jgi:hypothetical protein